MRGPDEGEYGLTDAEMEFAMAAAPDDLLERWAYGPWPEPHCGVCRGVWEHEDHCGWITSDPVWVAVQLVIDYHDEPLRAADRRSLWKSNHETYRRCLAIYEQAREVLSERRARESRLAQRAA